MTVSCGFSGPAVTCVLLIYRHYSRQANPEALSLSGQPGSSPAKAYPPPCRVGPCQVIQLYQVFWKQQQCISCTQMNSVFVWLQPNHPPPLTTTTLSAHLVSVPPPHSMRHVMGTMSETPGHSQTHLLSPPISRGDYSTFMVKSFFSPVRVNVMPLWPWLILVAIALICPPSYLLLGGGANQTSPSFYTPPSPHPRGSPVSSERPLDSWRGGGGRGQLDTLRGLASR